MDRAQYVFKSIAWWNGADPALVSPDRINKHFNIDQEPAEHNDQLERRSLSVRSEPLQYSLTIENVQAQDSTEASRRIKDTLHLSDELSSDVNVLDSPGGERYTVRVRFTEEASLDESLEIIQKKHYNSLTVASIDRSSNGRLTHRSELSNDLVSNRAEEQNRSEAGSFTKIEKPSVFYYLGQR